MEEISAKRQLPLGELRAASSTAKTGLLALFHAGVSGQEALLAELFRQVTVVSQQGAGNALQTGASLSRVAAAMDLNSHVDAVTDAAMLQRSKNRRAVLVDREEVGQLALVDRELALAGANPHAGHRCLPATSSQGIDDSF